VCAEGWPTGGGSGGRDGDDDDDNDDVGGSVLVKKPVITRLDSGHGDRKIRSSPPEDSTVVDNKGMRKSWGRGGEAVAVDVATPFFASLSAN